jgi:lactate dehydrogenase-like 2-hydroxyacid dehydrogenase
MSIDKKNCTVLKAAHLPPALVSRLDEMFVLQDWDLLDDNGRGKLAAETRVLVVNGETSVPEDFVAQFPALELITNFGVGYDGIDVAAARRRGIAVTNTPGVVTADVADFAFGLLLATARQIVDAQHFIEGGNWAHGSYSHTRRVSGRRLGIVGMGRIGQAVARRASGFDMVVSYTDRTKIDSCPFTYKSNVKDLAADSDFLIVCVSGGEKTKTLIDADVLSRLGADGILINVSRGSVVDEDALVAAIEAGIIAGAGIDVFQHEPSVPAGLQKRANVVITPHMACATHATQKAMGDLVFENISAHFSGKPLLSPVT